jgi:predicted permease
MSRIHGFLHRLRVLVDPDGYAAEVEREIRFHLDRQAAINKGVSLDDVEAAALAQRQFGNVTYVREEVRRMSGIEWIDRLRQNFSYAARGLRRSPGFTAAVVITLALGLGVNAAMFTFLDRVFVKPPAGIVKPNEVRRLYSSLSRPKEPNGRMVVERLWYVQVREIMQHMDSGVTLGLFESGSDSVAVKVGETTTPALKTVANSDYFRVLGVRPKLGRLFDSTENDIANPAPVAVITDAMWKRVFAGDPNVIGKTFTVKYRPISVIGVLPEKFTGTDLTRTDYWMPLGNAGSGTVRGKPWYDSYQGDFAVVTRFANAETERKFLQVASQVAGPVKIAFFGDSVAEIRSGPIQQSLGPAKRGTEVTIATRLAGVAFIVLLITLANVSNLLLVRATVRQREIAVRRALGVSKARLFEQLVSESLLLALLGGAVAILLAIWVGAALRNVLLPDVHWPTGVLDLRVVAFAGAAAVLTGIIVGAVPAIHAFRPDLIASLRGGDKSGSYRRSATRTGLLVAQAALSVVLLVGSGLFVQSLRKVRDIDVGFELYRTSIVRVAADTGSLMASMQEAMPALLERIARIPNVEGVAAASAGPMLGASYGEMHLPGHDSLPEVFGVRGAAKNDVTPGYFRTVGQRIIAGREFLPGDPPSLIVSADMARAYWPGESALGKCVILGKLTDPCVPVIGVVEGTHGYGIVKDDNRSAQLYTNGKETPRLVLRIAAGKEAEASPLIAAEVKRLVPRAQTVRVQPEIDVFDSELRPWRLGATLFTAMGILALIVAAVGVYSVIAYATTQRTTEMGIRIALGARLADIARLIVGDGLRTVAIGIALGIVLAIAAGKLVASLLYGISPRDPFILAGAGAALAVIGIVACVVPAWRAAQVDPVTALRSD